MAMAQQSIVFQLWGTGAIDHLTFTFTQRTPMKQYLPLFAFALFATNLVAQTNIAWQNTYGGSSDEEIRGAAQTPDGGYILIGHTTSSGGQVTGYQGNEDLWVVKTDASGGLVWQRALGSGSSEYGYAVATTADGGYIIAATADDVGGDIANIIGGGDIWLVKLNASGNIVWENTYGGTSYDEPRAVVEVDGGFIVAGYTESDNEQVTGYQGSGDLWVFKVDANGTLLWQRAIGGTDTDEAHGMRRTSDNGVIIAGSTKSNNGDVGQNFGNTDAWLVKLNEAGTIQWQSVYGHTGDDLAMDVVQRADGGYTFAAASNSQGGQVSQNFGNYDYWLVRTNPNGTLLGQNSYGGSGDDIPYALQQTFDGGYALAGYTASDNGNITNNLGGLDFWVVKTIDTGVLDWQRTLGGSDDDLASSLVATADGGYLVAGSTKSEDQDVTNGRGGEDFWAVKLQGNGTVGIAALSTIATRVQLFPDPVVDHTTVVFDLEKAGAVSYLIIDAAGRTILSKEFGILTAGEQRVMLDLQALTPGAYHFALRQGDAQRSYPFQVVR